MFSSNKRPGPKLVFAVLLLISLTLLTGVYVGRHEAFNMMQDVRQSRGNLKTELMALREALAVAQGELEVERTRREVDSRALELVRSEMAAERERTASLEEGLSFYVSMVESGDSSADVVLRQPELVSTGVPGHFAYRIFVHQLERDYGMVDGVLSVDVLGILGDEEVSYRLSELSGEFSDGAESLHFRYFQAIEGELVLPEGFVPSDVVLVARISKPREADVTERFPWELQERFINVGK